MAEQLLDSFSADLEERLISQDPDKARELVDTLEGVDDDECQAAATGGIGKLMKRDFESEDYPMFASDVERLIRLYRDSATASVTEGAAASAIDNALDEGWLPPEIAVRLRALRASQK